MSVGERDAHTGHMTTGHEWNGIKELNTPVPWAVYVFLALTAAFSFVYWLLMPAWPIGVSYTKGFLGIDQRTTVAEKLEQAASARAPWTTRIEATEFAEIQADGPLMQDVRLTGKRLFGDNCAACHGAGARGGKGFPDLTDPAWLWGGEAETVMETLRVGVNSPHEETRVSQMMAFGRDGVLDRKAILDVTAYVRSLSDAALAEGEDAQRAAAGKEVFAANCASCHGEEGKGNKELGAPDLSDATWIYGGDRQSIFTTIFEGRQGHMPHWEGRLSALDRKILTLYVLDLGGAGK